MHLATLLLLVGSLACKGSSSAHGTDGATDSTPADGENTSDSAAGGLDGPILYITSDGGALYAFEVGGSWAQLGHWTGLPLTNGVRGVDADPQGGVLFIAHGGDDLGSNGGLLAWSLTENRVVYDVGYNHGVDQLAFGGGRLYMPAGEVASTHTWYVLDAANGAQVGTETGGLNPHNTIVRNGHHYYGGRLDTSLRVVGIGAGAVGPSPAPSPGVRPFTVNARETRVWLTWTGYRGFSVGDVGSGQLLDSVNFGPVPAGFPATAPSHGISLSPSGSEVYVLDTPNNQVRVYDGTDTPHLLATITLVHPIVPGNESPCAYDCLRDGWLLHSRDGNYVYVGDSGDIIDTRTRVIAHYLSPLANSRHGFIEIEWSHGVVSGTTTHFGIGY